MGKLKFEKGKDLPVGSYEPCRLTSATYNEPDEEKLARWPDMKPSWCFKFQLEDSEHELNGYSAVRFCNHSTSKLSNLYLFLVDLNGGADLEEADPAEFVDKYFRISVRKRPKSDKLHASAAEPLAVPAASKPASTGRPKSKPAAPAPAATPAGPADDSDVPF